MTLNVHKRRQGRRARHAIARWQVYWRGRNVTDRVFYLDGRRRVARAYTHNAQGQKFVDRDRDCVATETLYGVEVQRL